jgi:diguanylate cyclase (GGDEF)-like protein
VLTGLYNRRFLEETLHREITRCKRLVQPLGIMLIDIDHFKHCNDTLGHASGDAVLAAVGKSLQGLVRGADVACRYGGEEFVILMPGAPLEVVRSRAETLCESVRRLDIPQQIRQVWPPSVSIGVALLPDNAANAGELLRAADIAMYQAKASGRDRVMVSGDYAQV